MPHYPFYLQLSISLNTQEGFSCPLQTKSRCYENFWVISAKNRQINNPVQTGSRVSRYSMPFFGQMPIPI